LTFFYLLLICIQIYINSIVPSFFIISQTPKRPKKERNPQKLTSFIEARKRSQQKEGTNSKEGKNQIACSHFLTLPFLEFVSNCVSNPFGLFFLLCCLDVCLFDCGILFVWIFSIHFLKFLV
jgi:hypothetical protein